MTAHPNGQWCKKTRGQLYYFGPWDDPDAALCRRQAEAPDLLAGREPTRGDWATLTVKTCVNAWLTYQEQRVESGEITSRACAGYVCSREYLIECLGRQRHVGNISPLDWARLRTRAGNEVTRSRAHTPSPSL